MISIPFKDRFLLDDVELIELEVSEYFFLFHKTHSV